MRDRGFVKLFDRDRGYGFIQRNDGQDFFCHVSNIEGEVLLMKNQKVSFDVGTNPRNGKLQAVDVRIEQ